MLVTLKTTMRRITKISTARDNAPVAEIEPEVEPNAPAEGDGEGEGDDEPPVVPPASKGPKNDPPTTVPQDKVNKLLADERRKSQEKIRKLTAEMEKFRQSASMTSEEKQEMASRLEELNMTLLSKEEVAAKRLKETQQKAATELQSAKDTAALWQTRFERSLIERTILDAAGPEAIYAEQFIPVLAPNARVVEKIDENGHPTNEFEVKVKLRTINAQGVDAIIDLPVSDAVQDMKKQPKWQNLFKSAFTAGTGFSPGTKGPGTTKDIASMSPEEYRKHRKTMGLTR